MRIGRELALIVFLVCGVSFRAPSLAVSVRVAPAISAVAARAGEESPPQPRLLRDEIVSAAAFESIIPVLRHPRCMNCHSTGDFPRQGDDSHRHTMQIRRGPHGHGVNGVNCSTCHQDHNLAGTNMPPGAPGWHLPPPESPMVWEGLSDHQLCKLLLDPKQNGNRNPEQILEHMHTPLVLWGWNPGEGRVAIPMASEEFLAKVNTWLSQGAACPKEASRP
jgi:hypothetical protein